MAAGGVLVGRGYVSIRPEFEGDWSNQVNARASRAGKGGAGAFSKAFGIGLKGIGALAGVAVAANLSSAAAGAAALAPALATAGAAAGALKLGLSGVGDAFKAAFSDSTADASAAASATKAVEGAQRGLANAQRALAQARVDAAERVKDAQRGVLDAERDLADAQREARDVQRDLNGAREEASRALEDMNMRLKESQLDEREATLRLTEAQKELAAARANPGTTPDQLSKLQLAYDKAKLNLQEQRTDTKRLAEDTKAANKAGIEGSQQVLAVKERIADANRNVADKERAVGDAQADVDKARRDGAQQVADAQRAVADAAAAVADAQAAAAAQTSKLDQAMSKLSPNARSFVNAVRALSPAWTDMRLSVQNSLFKGLDSTVTQLGRTTIPILKRQLTGTAGVWNQIAKSAAGGIQEMAKSGMLDKILAGATKNLAVFKDTPKQIITAFGQLTVAAQPAFNKLLTQFAGAITHFTDGIAKSFESGGLQQAIDTAFGILSQFGTLLGNAFGVVSQIFKAASDAGGQIVGVLGQVFGEIRDILAAPEMQATLRQLFASVAQIVGALVPVIGAIVQAIVPLAAALAQPIAELAVVLGPVLQQLVSTLGAALMPVIQALMPVLVQVGTAIVEIVRAVMPLLQPIAELIAGVISALAPALPPIIAVVQQLVGVLIGPLTQIVRSLTPVLIQIGGIIAQVFQALMPFLTPLVRVIGQVAELIAKVLSAALSQVMKAIQPLIPIAMQLLNEVFGALAPILPILGDAIGQIATAFLSLLGPLGEVFAGLASQLLPVIVQLLPVVGDLYGLLGDTLAQVLPILAQAFMQLVAAIVPILPSLGNLLGLVLKLGAGLIVQLLPSLLQLVQAAVQLLVAFLPILPPLASLIGLVIRLAVGVLNRLLPPLLRLADFLIGGLAGALSTVIGWISGVIKVMAGLVTAITTRVGPAFTWLNDKVVKPAMSAISTAISGTWKYGIKPVFDGLKLAVAAVATGFDLAQKAIKIAWEKLRGIARAPVQFIVDTVYEKGIRGVWNVVAGAFGAPKLPAFKFASGGVLPGYTPGRDPHKFYSPTGGRLEMSGGEAIMRPEFTRAVGPGFVSYFNSLAKSGGAEGVRRQLAPLLGGNPRTSTDRSLKYADGGIFGWIKSAGSAIKGAGSAAWNKIKESASWLTDTLEASARAGVKKVVDPLLRHFPGMDTGFGQMLRKVPDRIINALTGYSKTADKKGGGGLGGPKIQSALRWAKTQAGLPYQWAGNGNPSWDCSGFMSAIESVLRGQKPHRRWATMAFSGKTAPPGWVLNGASPFRIGITNAGVGHTAGTIGGVNVESRGGDGVVVGKRARGYNDRLFPSWYGFQPGKYDAGGFLQPGFNLAYNGTGKPEPVLTGAQFNAMARSEEAPITVEIHTQDRVLADFIDVRVHRNNEELISVITAS
ncbi:hypothetical protein [Streptomyces sp. NPDC048256]|uniref:hypothetical protein n=1 Tax=Streptomyces sp. NPDC048256 TaxID=3154613 RepID=UPI0033FA5A7D